MIDIRDKQTMGGSIMAGRRLLISLPPSRKERGRAINGFIEAAKQNWDIEIDAICDEFERRGFERLVKPRGHIYCVPHLLPPQPWESDPEAAAAVERQIHEAELSAGLPIGRFVLGAAHSVGRAYSVPVRLPRLYALVRRVLKDNAEPFVILRRLFHFVDEVLANSQPDLVYAQEYATGLNGMLWLAAKRRNIPCVAGRYSKLVSGNGFWSTERTMLNLGAVERGKRRRRIEAPISQAARSQIAAFRNQPEPVAYIARRWRHRAEGGILKWHARYIRTLAQEARNRLQSQDRSLAESPGSRLYLHYRFLLMNRVHQRFLISIDERALTGMKYFYFPMHKEAELAQTWQATQWYDQRNTIRVLASVLPFGYRLLVREHRMNFGHRPTRFYREVSRIPNVVLIDPADSQFKYLRHAELVVTENGSSGWEGLILGRRVLLLSDTFYDGAELGCRVNDPERLNEAILKLLSKPAVGHATAHDHALGCAVDGELDTSFPMTGEETQAAIEKLAIAVAPYLQRSPQTKCPAS